MKPAATVALNATVRDGPTTGWEQLRCVDMKVGDRRLMLAVPPGFRAQIPSADKVVLVNDDYSCVLSFRIAAPGSAAGSSLNADLCRAWLEERLQDLSIQEEFSLNAANASGPAFDLQCKMDGVVRTARVAFIASPFGVLEFNAMSSPAQFETAKATLRSLMRGFQISAPNGKLSPPTPPGET